MTKLVDKVRTTPCPERYAVHVMRQRLTALNHYSQCRVVKR